MFLEEVWVDLNEELYTWKGVRSSKMLDFQLRFCVDRDP